MDNSEIPRRGISRKEIANRFKAFREAKGITQAQIASVLGIHATGISDIENQKQRLTDQQLAILRQVYGLNLSWLLLGEAPMTGREQVESPRAAESGSTYSVAPPSNQGLVILREGAFRITVTVEPISGKDQR